VFFLYPFFAPKRLPSIALPLSKFHSFDELQQSVLETHETAIALDVLAKLQPLAFSHHLVIDTVDFVRYAHTSIFRREVVVIMTAKNAMASEDKRLYIRLSPKRLFSSLKVLSRILASGFYSGTIDLRYDRFAILSGEQKGPVS
jgi:hypothetical protein